MSKSVNEAFDIYAKNLIPSKADRKKASSHRDSIETKLKSEFGLYRMYESGSWKHGTGVVGFSDVDYFISLKTAKPLYGSSALASVKTAMQERFPTTTVRVSTPAVVLDFGNGYERVELIPAYPSYTLENNDIGYSIPGVRENWMESSPESHLKYVNKCNQQKNVKGGAKKLARLVKAWKYLNDVPISSFYLEMRASKYMTTQSSVILAVDMKIFLSRILTEELSAMNDPTGNTGRIYPCSSDSKHAEAMSKLKTAVTRAEKAVAANKDGKVSEAFLYWNLIFSGTFPNQS